MFIASYALTAPAAYVSKIHYGLQDTTPACTEPPHPDHDAGGVSGNSVTGQNEFSHTLQITFTVPVLMPLQTPEFAPDSNHRVKTQTRALGKAYCAPSKMRGRS